MEKVFVLLSVLVRESLLSSSPSVERPLLPGLLSERFSRLPSSIQGKCKYQCMRLFPT
ncbi:hypothetical protein D3C80_2205140 [compost metagenome]